MYRWLNVAIVWELIKISDGRRWGAQLLIWMVGGCVRAGCINPTWVFLGLGQTFYFYYFSDEWSVVST